MYGPHYELVVCPDCDEPDIEVCVEYVDQGTYDPETYSKDTREVVTLINRGECVCPGLATNIGTIWNEAAMARWERQQEAMMEG